MTNRINPFFRQRLTPWSMEQIINYPELIFGNFIKDLYAPGVVAGSLPKAHSLGGWRIDVSQLVGYANTGQRISMDRAGTLDAWWQGDCIPEEIGSAHDNIGNSELSIEPLSLPGAGKEIWVSVGVNLKYLDGLQSVDGYGNIVPLTKKLAWQFRVVHGEAANQGQSYRPDKSQYFKGGILLCDILILPGQTGISQVNFYYDRTDYFALKNIQVLGGEGIPSFIPMKCDARSGFFPGIIQETESGQWIDRFHFHPTIVRRATVVLSELKSMVPGGSPTNIEIDKTPDFNSAEKITATLLGGENYVKDESQLTIEPLESDGLYIRCSLAGGHEWVNWNITFICEQ